MKLFNIDFSFNKALTKEYVIILTLFIVTLISVVGVALLTQSLMERYDLYSVARDEVKTIETRINLVDSYKLLSPDEIQENTRLLEELIPPSDTNLSMYYILDDLSVKSGLDLSNYQLSSSSEDERSQVSVSATGTPDDLISFLNRYMFITGRLLTLQSIEIRRDTNESEELNIRMVLNYYTINIRPISKVQKTVSQSDIEFLRTVRERVQELRDEEREE